MNITKGRLYKCPNHSLFVRVLNIYHVAGHKVVAKLRFEYKSGMICETKTYSLDTRNIQHWEQIYV